MALHSFYGLPFPLQTPASSAQPLHTLLQFRHESPLSLSLSLMERGPFVLSGRGSIQRSSIVSTRP